MRRRNQTIFLTIAILLSPGLAFAYGVETHAGITREAARFYNQEFSERRVADEEIQILMRGAIAEDEVPRFLNHFYDPVTGLGLNFAGKIWVPSKKWAQSREEQLGVLYNYNQASNYLSGQALAMKPSALAASDYTWQRAIRDYAEGRTERGLAGLGHVLHLLEDMTVPAHTRNDPHPSKDDVGDHLGDDDPYETWTHKFNAGNIDVISRMSGKSPILLSSLDNYYSELAGYTNSHFYSKDSFADYIYPRVSDELNMGGYIFVRAEENGDKYIVAIRKFGYFENYSILTTDTEQASQSSWDRLSVKAVQYGAGLINLFFKEVDKIRNDPNFTVSVDRSILARVIDSGAESVRAVAGDVGYIANVTSAVTKKALSDVANDIQYMASATGGFAKAILGEDANDQANNSDNYRFLAGATNQFVGSPTIVDDGAIEVPLEDAGSNPVNQADDISLSVTNTQKSESFDSSSEQKVVTESTNNNPTIEEVKLNLVIPTAPYISPEPFLVPPTPIIPPPLPWTTSAGTGASAYNLPPEEPEVIVDLETADDIAVIPEEEAEVVVDSETADNVEVVPEEEPADTVPPEVVNDLVLVADSATSITLSWTTPSDAASCQARYAQEVISDELWEAATIASSTVVELVPKTQYFVAVRCSDDALNESGLSNIASVVTPKLPIVAATHVVISELRVDDDGADVSEFIELYNPTGVNVDISGWSLQYLAGSATDFSKLKKKNFPDGATIPANGFYLIGTGDYSGSLTVDMTWSQALNNTGATIILIDKQELITEINDDGVIDRVAYGSGDGLLPEENMIELSPVGQSLERKLVIDNSCVATIEDQEFNGNTCDIDDNSLDFIVRASPTPQSSLNLPEPRSAPAWSSSTEVFATYTADDPSPQYTPQVKFSWPEAVDAAGQGESILYELIDTTDELVPIILATSTSGTSFSKNISQIGRSYNFSLKATDRDGLAGEVSYQQLTVPGYFTDISWYKDGEEAPDKSDRYTLELHFDKYPFIPLSIGAPTWHMVLPYRNTLPDETLVSVDATTAGRFWGHIGNESGIQNDYWTCSSFQNNQAIVFPDTKKYCDPLVGGVKGTSYSWDQLSGWDFKKAVVFNWGSKLGEEPVIDQDYLTFAFYGYVNSSNDTLRLIAIDPTKYYYQSAPSTP